MLEFYLIKTVERGEHMYRRTYIVRSGSWKSAKSYIEENVITDGEVVIFCGTLDSTFGDDQHVQVK